MEWHSIITYSNATLAAVKCDAGSAGDGGYEILARESGCISNGSAHALGSRENNLADFLAGHCGADIQPYDTTQILELKAGVAAFGIHRSLVDVGRAIIFG